MLAFDSIVEQDHPPFEFTQDPTTPLLPSHHEPVRHSNWFNFANLQASLLGTKQSTEEAWNIIQVQHLDTFLKRIYSFYQGQGERRINN